MRLTGTKANRDGDGAMVSLIDGGRELDRRAAGASSIGMSSEVLHFGLGERRAVAGLRVVWPGGKVQEVSGPIAADQVLAVVETP